MFTRTVRFEEVKSYYEKRGACAGCGKQVVRKTSFSQTINPFNKAADGSPKTHRQILDELNEKGRLWKLEPIYHAKCED